MNKELPFSRSHLKNPVPSLDIGDFQIAPQNIREGAVSIINLDPATSEVLSTDISGLRIPIDPKEEYFSTLGELLTTPSTTLKRSFNIGMGRKRGTSILRGIFNYNIDYSLIKRIQIGNRSVHTKYPFPNKMNSKVSSKALSQIEAITSHTLKWYEGKSIEELLSGAYATQTFWDFCMECLRNGIKLNP